MKSQLLKIRSGEFSQRSCLGDAGLSQTIHSFEYENLGYFLTIDQKCESSKVLTVRGTMGQSYPQTFEMKGYFYCSQKTISVKHVQ